MTIAVDTRAQPLTPKTFWDHDLEVIEGAFLGSRPITSLPVVLDNRVPPQGGLRLHRAVDLNTVVRPVGRLTICYVRLSRCFARLRRHIKT